MKLVLWLNTIVEGMIAFLFLFYDEVRDLLPGFGMAEGPGVVMLTKMYGVAALIMSIWSLVAYYSRDHRVLLMTTLGLLALFHTGIAITQLIYNPDPRASLLHFLMALFLSAIYVQQRVKPTTA